MPETTYRNRRAFSIENSRVRVTVTVEGGHLAELLHKPSAVNPLWQPPWPSIEPSTYDRAKHPEYGNDSESKLLSGILGHNLCLDFFGAPSPEEAAAGLTVHGEASVAPYRIAANDLVLTAHADLPVAQLRLERRIELVPDSAVVRITEVVENLSAADRPIGWTEHVTLGPPFLERGSTQFRASATKSKTAESDFSQGKGYMKINAEFDWPDVPHKSGGTVDMRVYTSEPVSSGFTSHLMDPHREQAFFLAWSPSSKVLLGYIWNRTDFPWLGIWEENHARMGAPWNGKTLTRGMEFGASPVPESRRQMIDRNRMFGMPVYRWIPARGRAQVHYCAFVLSVERIPDEVKWDDRHGVEFS